MAIFPNYESSVERDDVKEPFSEVRYLFTVSFFLIFQVLVLNSMVWLGVGLDFLEINLGNSITQYLRMERHLVVKESSLSRRMKKKVALELDTVEARNQNFFEKVCVSMFKKNYDHLTKEMYFGNYKEATRGNLNYILTYGNGKSAAQVQDHLHPNGVHRWHNYMKSPKEMEVIKFEGSPQVNLISLKWKWIVKSF
ncbi:hypothetical protein H5410_004057 [Solanum commersonii]|uniref:Uncharacterized protein n=1 Tax=Solanum commersonii TaxID=4109 RepID=A0A9J6B705_SOLCO|nr:hypothetical protein H5410_004057 [Solanum commersonii]